MTSATVTGETGSATSMPGPATIRPEEAVHFGRLAAEWWDPAGSSAMLHRLNPVRLGFIRDAIDSHWHADVKGRTPLAGKRALDVGCGAGLLCEPLARMGAAVTGVDAAAQNIAAAKIHAEGMGLEIAYHAGELASLPAGTFDLVTAMEVIEHVADKAAFVRELAARLAPGGLMVLSTPNRTAAARLLLVEGAELIGQVPRGTHHWGDFITPDELDELLAEAGLVMGSPRGIGWTAMKGLHLSADKKLNYIVTATRG
ncbi:bifunctional 2-polyprenyl-6-hydroxyphenol methylase/3-demethylubiquinol 3-O-methyltransferase UbiG [Croceicoccus sp. BE223]|uniref:bifunctional 2-polyprenyl-6-hydroxyphenol methylase/3-demethylubiquinol 3-O-methyltransferase UbiG n=1 Tax=Croceicoccus sp. BE223 TaxID=2817716 RepID=UPI002856FB94|nr:bifunctional 2-polyprenyl-6-hydroxyphenol methylase/3-demethylubiquinol 3-O-methyltransferase UbiG [Croceicoccus sp. BE223]MDR7100998.1 2-polyprenyl-6-hydroxyphenyl methylase/3-demethylubiquinone-9 3-methyltransferase [Croceicoccus sp. BE223]